MKLFINNRGDTLVEVLLATVVLSIVLAGAYTLSNRATRINQQAFERTQVTNLLQQQAELVRSARDAYIPSNPTDPASLPWANLTSLTYAQTSVADLGSDCSDISILPANSRLLRAFHIDATFNVVTGLMTGQALYNIWAELESSPDGTSWDVHVFGCWEGIGNSPTNESSIVLRLGDPR